ncbi:WhiB family transcriptional regulator [Nocardioides marmorisolisilvae]|uniref:Transcriptional regulator WhiB n=1 Tax=Nocardioides marmorisolisilvae TaxID=1542737 RepID=A0A3N0DPN4_9ACTN|nr:WhiB family transcriptional regulator [Nocardioides marmorisolisilvae]RNL77617.1 WhiB family transcriptional regulator [Nocardioides marmorisolisilvae]
MKIEGDWSNSAACLEADPELFFPIGESPTAQRQIEEAREICANCPVRRPCLSFALKTNVQYGIWAGTVPVERARLRKRMTILGAKPRRLIKAKAVRATSQQAKELQP